MMYLARLQQGLKVPNSIVMRVYECAKREFKAIALLNFKHHSDSKYNRVLDEKQDFNMRQDFNPEDCDIQTAIDPSQGSDIERQQRADVVLQEAKGQPQAVLNLRLAYLNWLEALGYPEPEELAPEPSGEPDMMQKVMLANLQREASLAQRDMTLKEVKLEFERIEIMAKVTKQMQDAGLAIDKQEAEITDLYATAMKKLWEIGLLNGDDGDAVDTVLDIEGRVIDGQAASLELPQPVDSAIAQKEAQAAAPQGGPPQQ